MSVVKFEKEKQKKMKGISRAIYVLAKIGKVLTTIAIPIIALVAIISIYLVANININNNVISFKNSDEQIVFIEANENGKMVLKIGGNEIDIASELKEDVDEDFSKEAILGFMRNLNKTSKAQRILFVILFASIILANLILTRMLLDHLEKLFKNFMEGETPFTLENVNHIKKMAYFMIATIATPVVLTWITKAITTFETGMNLEINNIIEILFLFAMTYVFEYGYEIQKDSNGRIYGDEND